MTHKDEKAFTAAKAQDIAERAGYKATQAPRAKKKHFVIEAVDSAGENVQIDVHHDGRIVNSPADSAPGANKRRDSDDKEFSSAAAEAFAAAAGYILHSAPVAEKKHFSAQAKDSAGTEAVIEIHRDGRIKVKSATGDFSERAALALAERGGFVVEGRLTQHKKHFVGQARDARGVPVNIDIHADGRIVLKIDKRD